MSIVAISETLGSQGIEIGRELGRALGWEFADREIIAKAAERFGEATAELQHITEEKPTLWERFTDSKRHYLSYVEATIFEMAARDNAILVGHGAAVILREIPHVLRVRITAPERIRAERLRQQQGMASDEAALALVRDADHERASRMKFLYHVDLDDPLLYDVAVNTERFGVEESVALVRDALQSRIVQPTEASRAVARDRSLAAQAKARLLVDPTTRGLRVSVTATNGHVTVGGTVDSDAQHDAALKIVGEVPGVVAVTDEILVIRVPTYARA